MAPTIHQKKLDRIRLDAVLPLESSSSSSSTTSTSLPRLVPYLAGQDPFHLDWSLPLGTQSEATSLSATGTKTDPAFRPLPGESTSATPRRPELQSPTHHLHRPLAPARPCPSISRCRCFSLIQP
ncbi:hypothetical protein LY76DRAFT_247343 [Colletotrichum caudatum]|nr:hypothetical protein LY76DRAFT_247343 [Colletotrichum caudatum]